MANKIVLSKRFSNKLVKIFAYADKNFPAEETRALVDKIDSKITIVSHHPGIGLPSLKIPGMYKIIVNRSNKMYYRIKGRKILLLDMLHTRSQDID